MAGTKIVVQTMFFLIKKNLLSNMFLSGELWLEISAITFASQVRSFLFCKTNSNFSIESN
jgi:hypothetical protein